MKARGGLACAVVLLAAAVVCAAWAADMRTAAKAPPTQHFVSRPDLRPPPVRVITPAHGTAPGLIFIAPKKEVDQAGPMILDDEGNVVWFHTLDTKGVTDFRAQRYRGRPVLTWWRGESARGIGNGRYVIRDDSYHVLANVKAGHGLSGDIHEFLITSRNTALFTVYHRVPYDLSSLGGPSDGAIEEGVVQEVSIQTGRVLFEWHSFPQITPDESYESVPDDDTSFDYFHINAVEPDRDGNLLVSARNTNAIYKIRRSDGKVLWRLGGKNSDFAMGRGTTFAWQHDIRRQPDGTLTLFDNAAAHPNPKLHSKVLVLRVDERRKTATLVRSYSHPKRLLSTSQGNAQFLSDGHVFVGWGANEYYTEFDRQGRVLLDVRFGGGEADSYRAYRLPWIGRPTERPAVAVRPGKRRGRVIVYASWNGATEVRGWRVLAGERGRQLRAVAEADKDGFETAIRVDSDAGRFAVQALDAKRRVLSTSSTVARG